VFVLVSMSIANAADWPHWRGPFFNGSTDERDLPSDWSRTEGKGTVWLLRRSALLGTHVEQWARQMLEARGIAGVRVLLGLLSLASSHSPGQIDQACAVALTHGAVRLKTIRQLLQRGGPVQQQFAFLDEHPIIRPLADYESIVQGALGTEENPETPLSQKGAPV